MGFVLICREVKAGFLMSDFIKIHSEAWVAFNHLAQEVSISEPPSAMEENGNFIVSRNDWEAWVNRQGRSFARSSFVDLFRAQQNDDDPDSLSLEDLQLPLSSSEQVCVSAGENSDEAYFSRQYGYPEAIISYQGNRILRMASGAYWRESLDEKGISFIPLSRQQGRNIEAETANSALEMKHVLFTGLPSLRHALKTTMGAESETGPSLGEAAVVKGFENILGPKDETFQFILKMHEENSQRQSWVRSTHFSGNTYLRGNRNSSIMYHPESAMSLFYLSQPQNGCIAAATLNGAIFSGKSPGKDSNLLIHFHNKLMQIEDIKDGRSDINFLIQTLQHGNIPGLTGRFVPQNEVGELVNLGRPVITLTRHFSGHAMLITQVDSDGEHYHAIDTVGGMKVRRNLKDPNDALLLEELPSHYVSIEVTDWTQFLLWIHS